MAEAKETICTHCDHLWVCRYKEELLSKATEIDKIMKNSRFSYVISCPDYIIKNPEVIRSSGNFGMKREYIKEGINPMKAVKTTEIPTK